jgi:glycosyltransferase involved in cell wall biosynthesis
MKVGVFLEDIPPEEGGGYTMQGDLFRWFVKLAPESRHQFSVFAAEPEGLKGRLSNSSIGTIRFPGSFAERAVSKARRDVAGYGKQNKGASRFDEVARTAGLDFIWFVGAEALQVDMPYMAVVWDLQHRLQPWFPEVSAGGRWKHREQFYSEFLRRAAFVIAGTEAGKEEIQRFYQLPAHTIKILKHPTPSFALEAASHDAGSDRRRLVELGLTEPYLLYPAQLWAHKNHANLFYALRVLKDKYNLELRLALVGSDKGNQDYLKRLALELKIDSQVKFLGFVSGAELIELYRNALALTYVSYFGPENLPPLEAFALGCPVIAANVSGATEQLGDSALLVDPSRPETIADAIQSVNTDPAMREKLVTRGRVRAQSWTAADFVRGVFSILDEFEMVRRCWDS